MQIGAVRLFAIQSLTQYIKLNSTPLKIAITCHKDVLVQRRYNREGINHMTLGPIANAICKISVRNHKTTEYHTHPPLQYSIEILYVSA